MKLITFYGAFNDGLLKMSGHGFDIAGRTYVVHRGREPFDKEYRVTEMETGFAVAIPKAYNRAVAIKAAKDAINSQPKGHLEKVLKEAAAWRATLKVIG